MTIVTIQAAEARLSGLIDRACAGEEIVIAWDEQRMVRLVPVEEPQARKRHGSMKGLVRIGPEFFEPIPPGEL